MRPVGTVIFSMCIALANVNAARAREDVSAFDIVTKAIEARGGTGALARLEGTLSYQCEAVMYLYAGHPGAVSKASIRFPSRLRFEWEIEGPNGASTTTTVVNGERGWQRHNGILAELDQTAMRQYREWLRFRHVSTLWPLANENFELSRVEGSTGMDREAHGLRLKRDAELDIELYFDKRTFRLTKSRMLSDEGEVLLEDRYSEYKTTDDGDSYASHIESYRDGTKVLAVDVTSIKFEFKDDDAIFQKP